MRILITTGIYPPDIGGPATYVPQLAADLIAYGHSVEVITLGESNFFEQKSKLQLRVFKRAQPKLLRTLKVTVQILKSMRKSDAIFSNGLFPETAYSLCFNRKLRAVAKIVGDPVWEKARNQKRTSLTLVEFNNSKLELKYRIYQLIFKWSWNRFQILTCPSLELVKYLHTLNVSPQIVCVKNGVETKKSILMNDKEYDLLCVARLVTWKNVDLVISAASKLGLRLAIVGSGPEEGSLKELASNLNSRTKFFGQRTKEQVNEIMMKSSMFVQISDYEGLSFSLLEAMSFGLVPIVSANDGNKSVVVDHVNGIIVPVNLGALESAISTCLNDNQLFDKLATEARQTVLQKFDGIDRRKEMINLITSSSYE